jgi:hypothetical protein
MYKEEIQMYWLEGSLHMNQRLLDDKRVARRAIVFKRYWPEGRLRAECTGPKGLCIWTTDEKGTGPRHHCVQKVPARRAIAFKRYRPEGPLRPESTGPKGFCTDDLMIKEWPEGPIRSKRPARRAIAFKRYRTEGPLRSKGTGPKGHYVQRVPAQKAFAYEAQMIWW